MCSSVEFHCNEMIRIKSIYDGHRGKAQRFRSNLGGCFYHSEPHGLIVEAHVDQFLKLYSF